MNVGEDRNHYVKQALRLEYFTIFYNLLEATAAIGLGIWAGSLSLQGFGFDSLIETASAFTLVWRLRHERCGHSTEEVERMEQKATRIVGITFFVLAAYILWDATNDLWHRNAPTTLLPGVIISLLSICFMIPLAFGKKRLAKKLESAALAADSVETFVCIYLSIILLTGSALYSLFGWWWVDSVASLMMSAFILKEGWEAVRNKKCC